MARIPFDNSEKKFSQRSDEKDTQIHRWHHENKLVGILGCHVDDFSYCGTTNFHRNVIDTVKRKFKISAEASSCFKYLGLMISQDKSGIKISQKQYIESLMTVAIPRNKNNDEKLTSEELSQLRSISGQISWVASQTRPDASFDSCKISNYGTKADISYLKQANKAVRKLKNKDVEINIPDIGDIEKVEIICYTDATHASLSCGSS